MNKLPHDLLSPIETTAPRNEWGEINRAAQLIAEGMALENIVGSTEDRVALVYELDNLFNAYAPYLAVEEKPFLISVIETPVAAKTTSLLRQQVESGNVTNNLVHKIREVPFGLNVLASDLNLFVDDAVLEQKNAFDISSKREREDKQYQADVLTWVAANYGLNIPAIDSKLPSGGAFKTEQVNRLLQKINKIQDREVRRAEREALEAFVATGYAKQVKDFETLPSRIVNQLNSLFDNRANKISKVVATAALLGVAGPTLSATAAHAAPPVVNNDSRKGPSDATSDIINKNAPKPVMAKVGKAALSQQPETTNEVAEAQQNTVNDVEVIQNNDNPKVVARVAPREEAQVAKPASSTIKTDQDGRSIIVATPGARAVPEKPLMPPSIRKTEDGRPIIIAKPDGTRKERLNIVKVPLPETPPAAPAPETAPAGPAPAPEAPAPAPEALNEQQQFSLAAQKLIDRGGEWTNRGRLMKIFIESGKMSPMHAAAFIGNFMVEAPGLDPATRQGYGGPGRGFVQWGNDNPEEAEMDRFGYDGTRGLVKFAEERGTSWEDFDTQAQYVLHELATSEKGAYNIIMATTDREAATLAVSKFYERPGTPHNDRRVANANILAQGYNEELRAIQAAAQPPAPATPEIKTIVHPEREGMVGDIPYAYQLDPKWAKMQMKLKGGGTADIGPVACNPTSLSMVAMAIGDKTATPDKVYARYINDGRINEDGAHQQSLLDLAPAFGLKGNLVPNNDIEVFRKVFNDGGKIILSGNTGHKLLPSPGHFVVVYGISESGKMLVADPGFPENNDKEWSLQAQVDASNAIRALHNTTNAGLHYKAVALYPNK